MRTKPLILLWVGLFSLRALCDSHLMIPKTDSPQSKLPSAPSGVIQTWKGYSQGSRETGDATASIQLGFKLVQRPGGKSEIFLVYEGNHQTKDGYYLAKLAHSCWYPESSSIPGSPKTPTPLTVTRPSEPKDKKGFTDIAYVPVYIIAPGSAFKAEFSLGVVDKNGIHSGKLRLGRCGPRPKGNIFEAGNWDDTPQRQQEIRWSFVSNAQPTETRVGRARIDLSDVEEVSNFDGTGTARRYELRQTDGSPDSRPPGGFERSFRREGSIDIGSPWRRKRNIVEI